MAVNGARRVAVTGFGIVSCIGNDPERVETALREGRSGIRFDNEYAERGLNSRVSGIPDISNEPQIERKTRRFMGDAAVFAHHAMRKAIDHARVTTSQVSNPRTGLIVGSGVGSTIQQHRALETFRVHGLAKVAPYYVPQVMGSTTSACLAVNWEILGPSYSINSACSSAAHCIGHAARLISSGVIDRAFAGGAEEVSWTSSMLFDAMGALSTRWNDAPQSASRPYDKDRDGFVIAGGAGILVLEEIGAARSRGATIYAELAGYGASSDGKDMVQSDPAGSARAMREALAMANEPRIDYINTHATSTVVGDTAELIAVKNVFEGRMPLVSSTKGLTGHPIAAAGAHEAIYCLLMMNGSFVAASENIYSPDQALLDIQIVRKVVANPVNAVLSNSIGFGGSNASLIFLRTDR